MTIIPISAVYFMLLFNQLNRTMAHVTGCYGPLLFKPFSLLLLKSFVTCEDAL